jgi:hypothetical protein
MDATAMSLQEITDRLLILDVYSRYGIAIDDCRRDLLEQVFDEDTELASSDPSVPPRKGLTANWDRLVARHAAKDFNERRITGAPVILTLTADRCESLAECAIFMRPAGEPIRFEMLGLYHDTLVKRDGRWRFRKRFFDAVR